MSTLDTMPVREGQILAGKYRIERKLGAGGMGIVMQAVHLQLEQRVAIKFLLPMAAAIPEVVARFAREARAAAKVQGEHIVRVMDVAQLEDGTPYMVMEYLEGSDLAHEIATSRQLPVSQAVGWVLEACEAIADAHAAGIVHRDLKPANLFLSRRRDGGTTVKVLDFGISKTLDTGREGGPDMSLTSTSAVMGSPLYMSPEQMRSARKVDARADIWALGVILYESLTGKVPFDAEQMPELCAKVLMEEPRPITLLRPDVPPPIVAMIETCLRKDPSQRFQNVADLASALVPFGPPSGAVNAERARATLQAAGLSILPTSGGGPAAATAQSGPGSTGVAWETQGTSRKRPAVIVGVVVGALSLTAIPVALWLRARAPGADAGAPLVTGVSAVVESVSAPVQTAPLGATSASAAPAETAPVAGQDKGVRPDGRVPTRTPPSKASAAATPTAAASPAVPATTAPPPPATATATSKSNMNLK